MDAFRPPRGFWRPCWPRAGDLVFTGDPEGNFFARRRAHRQAALELSRRGGPPRIGRHLFHRRPPVHRDADGMGLSDRPGACSAVARTCPSHGLGVVRFRSAGGDAVSRTVLFLAVATALPRAAGSGGARLATVPFAVRDSLLSRSGWFCGTRARAHRAPLQCEPDVQGRDLGYSGHGNARVHHAAEDPGESPTWLRMVMSLAAARRRPPGHPAAYSHGGSQAGAGVVLRRCPHRCLRLVSRARRVGRSSRP